MTSGRYQIRLQQRQDGPVLVEGTGYDIAATVTRLYAQLDGMWPRRRLVTIAPQPRPYGSLAGEYRVEMGVRQGRTIHLDAPIMVTVAEASHS